MSLEFSAGEFSARSSTENYFRARGNSRFAIQGSLQGVFCTPHVGVGSSLFPLSVRMDSVVMDFMFDDDSMQRSAVLHELLGSSCRMAQKRRKIIEDKQPRRGRRDALGEEKWRIAIPENVWDELLRPERYDEGSWDGRRFRSIYGVPAVIFDQLVHEARALCGKAYHGDGRRGSFSKPVELKVAAVLEMCQSGLTFKTASRLYQISEQVLCSFQILDQLILGCSGRHCSVRV